VEDWTEIRRPQVTVTADVDQARPKADVTDPVLAATSSLTAGGAAVLRVGRRRQPVGRRAPVLVRRRGRRRAAALRSRKPRTSHETRLPAYFIPTRTRSPVYQLRGRL
jgi:hypothetical protein